MEQNRSYGLLETDISADLKGYNLNNIMENYCSFKYFEPILDPKAKKEFDYTVRRHQGNEDYYIMAVTPLDQAKKAMDKFEIVYDKDKKLIIEFTIISNLKNLKNEQLKTNAETKNSRSSFVKVGYRLDRSKSVV